MELKDLLYSLEKYGLKISNYQLYQQAFVHRSYLNEVKEAKNSNERLEFLGDSVLSFIVSSYLFQERHQDEEGDLTNLRAFMVKTDSLAKVASKLKLSDFLQLSKGEELSGGRLNPQLLANTFEALLGAIYLDLGIEAATTFIKATLIPYYQEEVKKGAPRDPKSELQELSQSKYQISPKYKILSTNGPDHAKEFMVGVFVQGEQVGQGRGSSKQQAEEEAAEQALARLTEQKE